MGEDQKYCDQAYCQAAADCLGRETLHTACRVPSNGKKKITEYKAVSIIEHSVCGKAVPNGVQKAVVKENTITSNTPAATAFHRRRMSGFRKNRTVKNTGRMPTKIMGNPL